MASTVANLKLLGLVCVLFTCVSFSNAVIRGSLDLYCDFETGCPGWKNGTELDDKVGFNVARSVVTDPWHSVPWPFQGVFFAYALGSGDESPQTAWLTTDTISCLLTPGYLTLYYWKNSFLSGLFSGELPYLKVGIRQPPWSPNIRVLSTITGNNQWGWRFAVVDVPPVNESFQIVIEAMVQGKLDIVGLDDIVFHGYVSESDCDPSLSKTINQQSKPTEIDKLALLSADGKRGFSQKPNSGAFKSQNHDFQASSAFSVDSAQNLVQNGALVLGPSGSDASFVQDGLIGRSRSSKANNADLESKPFVLTRPRAFASDGDETDGDPDQDQEPTPKDPFNKEATKAPNNLLRVGSSPTAIFKQVVSENCSAVNCGFEGDSCLYEGTDGKSGAWIIMQGRMGNPLTGVTGPAFGVHYAVAYTNNETSTQILRGPPFLLKEKAYLTFWYFFASARSGRVVLCDNDTQNCLWEKTTTSITSDSRKWQQTTVQLKAGKHQLYFVAEDLRANYYAALDQILLRKSPNGQYAECYAAN